MVNKDQIQGQKRREEIHSAQVTLAARRDWGLSVNEPVKCRPVLLGGRLVDNLAGAGVIQWYGSC